MSEDMSLDKSNAGGINIYVLTAGGVVGFCIANIQFNPW